ncbi:unnamed protein product, partial [Polarella glacialis]
EWRRTGETDPAKNWVAAERDTIRPADGGGSQGQSMWQELQELRRRDAEQREELELLRKQRQDATEAPSVSVMTEKVKSLQEELADTDQLVIQRNQHCRNVELAMAELSENFKAQAGELAGQKPLMFELQRGLDEAEHRCAEKDVALQELTHLCSKQKDSLNELSVMVEGSKGLQDSISYCGQWQSRMKKAHASSPGLLAQKFRSSPCVN